MTVPSSPSSKPRLLLLGTGFAAFSLLKKLDHQLFDVTVVSPRNHFLFTPLLPSTTVGTLEFRSIVESIRRSYPDIRYYQASSRRLDTQDRTVHCVGAIDGTEFDLAYDLLVISVGAKVNTFGIEGVVENALFLKTLEDARKIRRRIIECFEEASQPGLTKERIRQLLHFVVVGGGPTGVEFAAELHDFLHKEIRTYYRPLESFIQVTVVDSSDHLLSAFDHTLSDYTTRHFQRQNIGVKTGARAAKVEKTFLTLKDGTRIPYGLLVWATGLGPTIAVANFDLPKDKTSRIQVDGFLKVQGLEDVYALGDCSVVAGKNFAATAQVAMQQGAYLGKELNRRARKLPLRPFQYHHLGMMAYVGGDEAIADLNQVKGRGKSAYFFWRSAYLTRLVSWKNKVLVVFDWLKTRLFGRDISRF